MDAQTVQIITIAVNVLWGLLLLLIGYVLSGIRGDMAIHTADIKNLTAQLLAQYVPRQTCEFQTRDKWQAIEEMESRVQVIREDVAAIKERIKVRRATEKTE